MGLNALLIADDREALIGSFNLRAQHMFLNFEVGLLIRGRVVSRLRRLYDAVWECT